MELPSPPAEVLDKKFFHVTGIVMVVAALLAGSITLWLANDVATRELPDNIASTINIPPTALQKSERHLGEDLVVNVSFKFGRNSAPLPSR